VNPFETAPGATPLQPEDLEGLIPRNLISKQQLDELEAENILQAEVWSALQIWSPEKLLSSSIIRRCHKELFGKTWRWAGTYRKRETSIGVAPEQISVLTEQLIGNTLYQINESSEETKVVLARFHHQLVSIHLFPNGNGRHARFVCNILASALNQELPTWGAKTLIAGPSSRQKYLSALRKADATGDLELLVKFMWS
jgi:Fic-DOC domain mobile mystery protein B